MSSAAQQGDLAFSLAEYQGRVDRVREELARRKVDLMLVASPENIFYLSGFDSIGYYQYQLLFVPTDSRPLRQLLQLVERVLAGMTSWVEDTRFWQHGEDPIAMTVEMLREYGFESGRIGVELQSWWFKSSSYLKLQAALPRVELVDCSDIIPELRIVKSPAEIACVRRAAAISDAAVAAGRDALRPGVTEKQVAAAVYHALYASGGEYPSVPLLLNSGWRTQSLHGTATDRMIQLGDPVTIEVGGCWRRYNVNPLRTYHVGAAPERVREVHAILREAVEAATAAVQPGIPAGELDRITRRITARYDHGRLHRTGYGLEASYPPAWMGNLSILSSDPHILQPGMVFSIEPTLVLPEFGFGVILGNNVLVTDKGVEVLNQLPLDLEERA